MEQFKNLESLEQLREQALQAFKAIAETNPNPDNLDRNDPAVQQADSLHENWMHKLDDECAGNDLAEAQANFAKTMFFVDAGFSEQKYLDEVANDWLEQDLQNAESSGEEFQELVQKIKEAQSKLRQRLRISE